MSDTEEVVIRRTLPTVRKANTKPEIAREKLKEKRERLKKEKEDGLIEEAKRRLLEEEQMKKEQAELAKKQETEKKQTDPTYALLQKMEQMMSMMTPKQPEPEPKKKAPRKKTTVVVAEPVKPIPKQRKPRKKVVYEEAEDSPSNKFYGKNNDAPPMETYKEPEQEQYEPQNRLLGALASRRNMSSIYY